MTIRGVTRKSSAGFLVLDGPDGAGKTTVGRAVADRLRDKGLRVTACRDPGGTPVGDRIRSVLLDHDLAAMDVRCESLLFMASRAQLVADVVVPALGRGDIVLCDRYVSANLAYQCAAGADFDEIINLAKFTVGDIWPDLTVILDISPGLGLTRIGNRSTSGEVSETGSQLESVSLDAMERRSAEFHQRVRANFLSLSGRYPSRVEVVDASHAFDDVVQAVVDLIESTSVGSGIG